MNEENDITAEMPDSVEQQRQETLYQNSTLLESSFEDELNTVLPKLKALPLGDEKQKASFFENVQRLQGYHVIQIFNLGIAPLQKYYMKESLEFLDDVMKLFKICLSFCYATDVPKRVAFDYYVRALKFCFPSEPKPCLSTVVVSMLLQLVQTFQEGKLATIVSSNVEQVANPQIQINGTKHFIGELFAIFEKRRDEPYIEEIVAQTVRVALEDAKISCVEEHVVNNLSLRSEHVVSPVFLANWLKLLKLEHVSNSFACALAKMDPLQCTTQCVSLPLFFPVQLGITFQTSNLYKSTVADFVTILQEMERSGSEIKLPSDEERLGIFFKHAIHFCRHPNMTATSLKLLANTGISNEALLEILDQFCYEEKRPMEQLEQSLKKALAFELAFKVLSLFPDGKLVNGVLKFWRENIRGNTNYQSLAELMSLLVAGSSGEDYSCLRERAERTFNFLDWLPSTLLPFLSFWHPFLAHFIKLFPSSFQRRPEVVVLIHKAQLAARVPLEKRQTFIDLEHLPALQFLEWVYQQRFTEEKKNEMIWLFMCCADGARLGHNWHFSINVIKQLSLCQQLPFSTKKVVLHELTNFAKHFKEAEKRVFEEIVKGVTTNQHLELKDEILSEMFGFVKRFVDKERPMKTIPSDALQLLSLVSKVPISGDRKVKVLQKSKKSGKGLLSGIRILELIEQCNIHEVANEYFDLLYFAFVDILKEEKELCQQFYIQQHRHFSSAQVQEVWTLEVAKLISSGDLKEEIDCWCCFTVLNETSGPMAPTEMLQLFSQVRTSAVKIVHLLRKRNESSSSEAPDCLPQTFVSSLVTVVSSNAFSAEEKLLLVSKVCAIFLSYPDGLSEHTMDNAVLNLIPFFRSQISNSSSNQEVMPLEVNQIVALLENPKILAQLSRIPVSMNLSLSTVLSTMNSRSSSRDTLADVYHFISSQEDLDQNFFNNLLPVVEMAVQESRSLEDILEILRELVSFMRAIPSELMPFAMLNFGHLLQNQVNKQERERFLNEIVMKWDFSRNASILSYLKVPRLLWRAYTTADTQVKACDIIERTQEILRKTNEKVDNYYGVMEPMFCLDPRQDSIRRKIACCELEWLVLHSSCSSDEASLACNLAFSFRSIIPRLRCFTFADIQIEDGSFIFVPQETTSEQVTNRDNISTPLVTVGSMANESLATEAPGTILTPILIAQKVIDHLKRVGQEGDLAENALALWNLVFDARLSRCSAECEESLSFLDDYVDVFLSILNESSSIEMMLYWAAQDKHHVCQCSDVILKALKWSGDEGEISKEVQLKCQTAVSTTMETMRKKTPNPHSDPSSFIRFSVPCFRLMKPQLKQLSKMLESRLPIEVTLAVLDLFQINIQAGVTVGEIVSSWSCKQQAVKLIEGVKLGFLEEEMSSLKPGQSEFVWQLLKAFGRFCMDSFEDLLLRFKELFVLYDPEDAYGFNRLPKWREMMITNGFSAHVIDCWCVALLTTPLEELSSRDVDAIVDLDSRSLQLVASASQRIKTLIFPDDGFPVMEEKAKGIKEPQTRERLRLARLLGEFISVLKLRKPEENPKDAVIKGIVVDACNELCRAHENQNRRKNDLYKIHGQKLKALFTEVFGKQRKPKDEEDYAEMETHMHQVGEQESRHALSVARQTSYLHENLPRVLKHTKVYEALLVLLRRWLSRIVVKPTLASHTLQIVQLLFSVHSCEVGPALLKELHGKIQACVLSLEKNQALVAQLQAAGYNQTKQGTRDLWSSPTVECAGYLSRRDSADSRRLKKKLTEVLRRLWNECKDILLMRGIASIKVGDEVVCTRDLFGLQASLEEMEEQVAAVKKTLNQIVSDDLDRRVKHLMRLEKRHRARIEKMCKSNKVRDGYQFIFTLKSNLSFVQLQLW